MSPTSFGSLAKGSSYTLNVTLTAPADALPTSTDGTIQLRSGSDPNNTYAKPLPVDLTIVPFALPPDPGDAGKATLEGIDSDNDGVRDDVQRWIGMNAYPTESGRAALTQYAKAMQRLLISSDETTAVEAAQATTDATACFQFIRWSDDDAIEILGFLKAEYLNTIERSQRYVEIQDWLSGHIYSLGMIEDARNKCDFDPLSMDN